MGVAIAGVHVGLNCHCRSLESPTSEAQATAWWWRSQVEDGSAFVLVRQDVHPLQHRLCDGPICIQGGMSGAVEPSFTSGLPRAHHVLGHRSAGIIAVVFHAGNERR